MQSNFISRFIASKKKYCFGKLVGKATAYQEISPYGSLKVSENLRLVFIN